MVLVMAHLQGDQDCEREGGSEIEIEVKIRGIEAPVTVQLTVS